MGARPYAPQIGRFLAADPVEGGATTNAYGYVNDPVNTEDLNGQCMFGKRKGGGCKGGIRPLANTFNAAKRAVKADKAANYVASTSKGAACGPVASAISCSEVDRENARKTAEAARVTGAVLNKLARRCAVGTIVGGISAVVVLDEPLTGAASGCVVTTSGVEDVLLRKAGAN